MNDTVGKAEHVGVPETAVRAQFLIVFVAAAAGSAVLSWLGMRWMPALWASAWIVGYGIFMQTHYPDVAQSRDFADNYYYLGFLLTLVALIVVLVRLGGQDSDSFRMGVVLPQFGLALTTTLLGLVGRTYFLMFQTDPSEIEERAEQEAMHAFEQYRRNLRRLNAEVESFHDSFSEQLDASFQSFRGTVEGLEEIVSDLAAGAEPVASELEGTFERLQKSSDRIDEQTDQIVMNLSGIDEALTESSRELTEAFTRSGEAADQSASVITGSAEQLSQVTEETVEELEGISTFGEEIRSVQHALESLQGGLEHLERGTRAGGENLEERVDRLSTSVDRVNDGLRELSETLASQQDSVRSLLENWRQDLAKLDSVRDNIQESSVEASESLSRVNEELAASVAFLNRTLGDGSDASGA